MTFKSNDTKDRIIEILEEDTNSCGKETFCDILGNEIAYQMANDEESPRGVARQVLDAYQSGDANSMCIALTGWSVDSLIKLANGEPVREERKNTAIEYTIDTLSDNGSGLRHISKEAILKELSMEIDGCIANGGTYFDVQISSDASTFAVFKDTQ